VDERIGHVLVNNLLVAESGFQRPLLMVWQPGSLCEQLPEPPFKEMDHNVYVSHQILHQEPLILWSPAPASDCQEQFAGPDQVHAIHPTYATGSTYLKDFKPKLFPRGAEGNYKPTDDFPSASNGKKIPEQVRELLGIPFSTPPYIGAYPAE
jgi:hypothetical protein